MAGIVGITGRLGSEFMAAFNRKWWPLSSESADLLGKWAMNLMLINVSTRKFGRAVRLPEGDVPAPKVRHVQVGGVAPVRGAVCGTDEGVDGVGPVRA